MVESKYYIFENLNHAIRFDSEGIKLIYNGFEDRYEDFNHIVFNKLSALNPEISLFTSTSDDELRLAVHSAYEKQSLLSMFLEIMDSTFSKNYRAELARIAQDSIIERPDHLIFSENRLFSTILPDKFNIKEALQIIPLECHFVRVTLEKLANRTRLIQYMITLFRLHTSIPPNLWEDAYARITDSGLIYRWIIAIERKSQPVFAKVGKLVQEELRQIEVYIDDQILVNIVNDLRKSYKVSLKTVKSSYNYSLDMLFDIEHSDLTDFETHLIDSVNHFKKDGSHDMILALLSDNIISKTKSIKIKELRAISEYRYRKTSVSKNYLKKLGSKSMILRHLSGLIAYQEMRYNDALYIFESLANDYSDLTPIFLLNVGGCKNMTGDHYGALAFFNKVLDALPNDYDVHMNIGNAYLHLELYENAIQFYDQALAINPNDRRASDYRQKAFSYLSKYSIFRQQYRGDAPNDSIN